MPQILNMVKKNIFSISVALIIAYLSLAPGDSFKEVTLSNADKIVHFLMYLTLMSVIIFENRKMIKDTKQIVYIALVPFSYGVLMEILQFVITSDRGASFFDILSNLSGVIFSALMWLYVKPLRRLLIR